MKASIRPIVAAVLSLLLPVASLSALSAESTASESPAQSVSGTLKTWEITLNASVLSNQGDYLAVYLMSPENMATDDVNPVSRWLEIPVSEDTLIIGNQKQSIAPANILPGQDIRVTFQYRWQESAVQVLKCTRIAFQGGTVARKSSVTLDALERDLFIGTVVEVRADGLLVYLDSGRMLLRSFEYFPNGIQFFPLDDATLHDENGREISIALIKPLQRIEIRASEYIREPGQQALVQKIDWLHLLDSGEKLFSPSELKMVNPSYLLCTVLSVSPDRFGNQVVTVRPADGSREARLKDSYTFTIPDTQAVQGLGGSTSSPADLKPGMVLQTHYQGLDYQSSPGQLGSVYSLTILTSGSDRAGEEA